MAIPVIIDRLKFETVNEESLEMVAWDDGDIGIMGTASLFTLDEVKRINEFLSVHIGRME